jgi:hypothetical protein
LITARGVIKNPTRKVKLQLLRGGSAYYLIHGIIVKVVRTDSSLNVPIVKDSVNNPQSPASTVSGSSSARDIGFTDPSYATGAELDEVIEANRTLISAARPANIPVVYTAMGGDVVSLDNAPAYIKGITSFS